jgi:hypothetical protein
MPGFEEPAPFATVRRGAESSCRPSLSRCDVTLLGGVTGRSKVVPSTGRRWSSLDSLWMFGDRSQVVKVRMLFLIGVVIACSIGGAGWKWSAAKQTQHTHQLAGWSWDGSALD